MPTRIDLAARPTATDVPLAPGAPIWYRQVQTGGYGFARLVPGRFDRYGQIRVQVVLLDATGREHRVFVSPANVYVRFADDPQ